MNSDSRGRWLGALMVALAVATLSSAHCDTLDGPVVRDARAALARRDTTPVLNWVAFPLYEVADRSFELSDGDQFSRTNSQIRRSVRAELCEGMP